MPPFTLNARVKKNAQTVKSIRTATREATSQWYDFQHKYAGRAAFFATGLSESPMYWIYPDDGSEGYLNPDYNSQWSDTYEDAYESIAEHRSRFINKRVQRACGNTAFTFLGSGAFREAYLGPDGLVYKVGSRVDNETEVAVSQRLYYRKGCPDKFKIPYMRIHDEVVITELVKMVDDREPTEHETWSDFMEWLGKNGVRPCDFGSRNFMWDGSVSVATDMGNWYLDGKDKYA